MNLQQVLFLTNLGHNTEEITKEVLDLIDIRLDALAEMPGSGLITVTKYDEVTRNMHEAVGHAVAQWALEYVDMLTQVELDDTRLKILKDALYEIARRLPLAAAGSTVDEGFANTLGGLINKALHDADAALDEEDAEPENWWEEYAQQDEFLPHIRDLQHHKGPVIAIFHTSTAGRARFDAMPDRYQTELQGIPDADVLYTAWADHRGTRNYIVAPLGRSNDEPFDYFAVVYKQR